jgi:hypothetical protein
MDGGTSRYRIAEYISKVTIKTALAIESSLILGINSIQMLLVGLACSSPRYDPISFGGLSPPKKLPVQILRGYLSDFG